jgi:hypothetical protein
MHSTGKRSLFSFQLFLWACGTREWSTEGKVSIIRAYDSTRYHNRKYTGNRRTCESGEFVSSSGHLLDFLHGLSDPP